MAVVTVSNTVSATSAGMSDGETEPMKMTRPIAIPATVTTMLSPSAIAAHTSASARRRATATPAARKSSAIHGSQVPTLTANP